MAFSLTVVIQAWNNAKGNCECRRLTHGHDYVRCNKQLVLENRGREGRGAWEAHHINSNGGDTLSNCEILCWECHKATQSFGRS
jgi:hypothetical protein